MLNKVLLKYVKFTVFEDGCLLGCGLLSSSETSVNIYQTTRFIIPEDNHLHTRRRENLKSHLDSFAGKYEHKNKHVTLLAR
jgi:hypothetical protein